MSSHSFKHRSFALGPIPLAIVLLGATPASFALPQGAVPSFGQTTVKQTSPTLLQIQQGTQRAGIDWTSFSIAAGERVVVSQPGSSSVLVNRVLGQDPSQIFGNLQSNGSVWLINPRGIVFGAGSQVDVGGLLASTLSIQSQDLASGRIVLGRGAGPAGELRAEGQITAPGGNVILVAPQITQNGTLSAARVGMAAATDVTVDVEGDGLIFFNARNDGSLQTRLNLLGNVLADGGTADVRAAARSGFADTVLNLEGVVQARSIGLRNGRIVIDGGNEGVTRVAGTLDASAASTTGGEITVTGRNVLLDGSARLDASGAQGGGQVRVGGDFHGANPEVRNAEHLLVRRGATLTADAGEAGNGGSVVLWSDAATRYEGAISVKGGSRSGDGGQVEVSSHGALAFDGTVGAGAAHGRNGTLLLDPDDLCISTGTPVACVGSTEDTTNPFNSGGGAGSFVKVATLEALPNTAVTLQAGNDIIFEAAVNLTNNTSGGVTLTAGNAITMAGFALSTAGGNIAMVAGGGGITNLGNINAAGGTFSITTGAGASQNTGSKITGTTKLEVQTGTVTLSGANDYTGGTTLTGGTLALASAGAIGSTGAIEFLGGTLQFSAANTTDYSARFDTGNGQVYRFDTNGQTVTLATSLDSNGGSLTKIGSGTLVLAATSNYNGATNIQNGAISVDQISDLGSNGNINLGNGANTGTLIHSGGAETSNRQINLAGTTGGGVIEHSGGGLLKLTRDLNVSAGNKTLTLQGSGTAEFNGNIVDGSNTVSLVKTGNGTWILSGNNNFDGTTSIQQGALSVDTLAALSGIGALDIGSGTNTGTLVYTGTGETSNRVLNLAGTTGGAAIDQSGTGLLKFTGNLTATGVGSKTLTLRGSTAGTGEIAGAIVDGSGTTALTKSGTGTWTISGTNTYSGDTTIGSGGKLVLGAANVIPDGSGKGNLGVAGTLDLNGNSETINGLSSNGFVDNLGATSATLTVGSNDATSTFDGVIQNTTGNIALTKTGIGTLTLNNTNTYTGTTRIQQGAISVGAISDIGGSGALDIGNGANTGTLVYTGAGETSNRVINLAGTTGGATIDQSGTGLLKFTSNLTATGVGSKTLTLQGSTAGTGEFAGNIVNGSGTTALTKAGSGNWTLSGTNSNTGKVSIQQGLLEVSSIANLGGTGAIDIGSGANTGTLSYIGTGETSTRVINLAGTTGGAIIDQSGTGLLKFTSDLTATGAGSKTLLLRGSSGGTGEIAGAIVDGSGTTALEVSGTNTWTISGANTYSGNTSITFGSAKLVLGADDVIPDGTGKGDLSVTGTLDLNGRLETVNRLSGAGVVDNLNATAATLTVGSNDVSSSFAGVIQNTTGAIALTKTGSGTLTLTNTNTYTGKTRIQNGAISVGAIGDIGGSGAIDFGSGANTGTLVYTGTGETSTRVLNLAGTTGGATIDQSGTGLLKFSSDLTATVAGSKTLTLQGSTAGTGEIAGAIVDGSGTTALSKLGTGTWTISGANSYSGNTSIGSGGKLILGAAGAIPGGTGKGNVSVSGTLDLNGHSETLNGLSGNGTIDNLDAAAVTLTVGGNDADGTFSGVIQNTGGALALTKIGSGTLTLSNTNTYVGKTSIQQGTVSVASINSVGAVSGSGLGQPGTIVDGTIDLGDGTNAGTLVYTGSGEITDRKLNLAGTTGGATVDHSGSGLLKFTSNLSATGVGSKTLTLQGSTAGSGEIAGTIVDGSGTTALSKSGSGTWTISGANTYSGNTSVGSGGKLVLGAADVIPDGSGKGNVSVAGTLDLNGHAETINGLSSNGVVDNLNATGVTLTVGNDNATSSFSGVIQNTTGAIALTKTGSGTLTLSGANSYSGDTTIGSGGKLVLGAANVIPDGTGKGNVSVAGTLDLNGNSETINGLSSNGVVDNLGATAATLTVGNNNAGGTFAGVIQNTTGAIALTKTGSGTLTLSNTNTYTGKTSIQNGAISVGTLGDIGGSGAIDFGSGANTGSLVYTGTGETSSRVINLAGTTGGATIDQSGTGLLKFTSNLTATGVGSKTLTLQGSTAGSGEIAGTIVDGSGTTALSKSGSGSWTISGANTYSGNTSVGSGGTLVLGADNVIPDGTGKGNVSVAGTLDLNGHAETINGLSSNGVVDNLNATGVTLTVGNNNATSTFAGVIQNTTGTIALTKTGTGTLTLSNTNTYTGQTSLQQGTLSVAAISDIGGTGAIDIGSSTNTVTLVYTGSGETSTRVLNLAGTTGGATIDQSGTGLLKFTSDITATGVGSKTLTLRGSTAGSGEFAGAIVDGSGTTALAKSGSGTWTISGTNTYSGNTSVGSGGKLVLGAANVIPDGSGKGNLSVAGTLDLNGHAETLNGLSGSGVVDNLGATAATLTVGNNDATSTFAGVIQNTTGAIALTKTGSGTLTLSNTNTYTGKTSLQQGTLSVAAISAIGGTGAIDIGSGTDTGTLVYTGSGETTSRVLNLAGTTGGATIDQSGTGLLKFTSDLTATGAGSKTLTLQGSTAGSGEIAGAIVDGSGTTALTKAGTGTWTISGANTYSGDTAINGGKLVLGAAGAIPDGTGKGDLSVAGTLDLSGHSETVNGLSGSGVVDNLNAASATLTVGNNNATSSFAGVIQSTTGAIALTKTGSGTLTLSGANTYSGDTTIASGGSLVAAADGVIPDGSGKGNLSVSGTLDLNGHAETVNGLSGSGVVDNTAVGSAAFTVGGNNATSSYSGTLQNAGGALSLTKTGTGTLTLSGIDTYSGNTTIGSGGKLVLGAADIIPDGTGKGSLTVSGTLDLNGRSETVNGLSGSGVIDNLNATSATLTVGNNNATSSFAGVIQNTTGTIALSKTGTGTLTLGGANTYSGNTTIASGGTLALGADGAIPDGAGKGNVSLSGTLDLNGHSDTLNGLSGSGVVDNLAAGAGTLTVGSNDITSTFAGVIQNTTGAVALSKTGTGTLTLSGANTYSGKTRIQQGAISVASLNSVGGISASNLGQPGNAANGTIDLGNGASGGMLIYTGSGETTDRVLNLAGSTGGATIDQSGTGLLKFTSNLTATGAGSKTLTLQGSTAGSGEIAGIIVDGSGTTALTKAGSGTWTISGANTYSGNTSINGGTLVLGAAGVIPDGSGKGNVSVTGTLDLNGHSEAVNGLSGSGLVDSLAAGTLVLTVGGNNASGSFSGVIQNTSGSVALTKTGTGTQILGGANSYSGDTTISAGTLRLGAANVLPDGAGKGNLTVNGTLDVNGFSETVNALSGSGTVDSSSAGTPTLTVGANDTTSTFSGSLQNSAGTLALIKTGTGTLTLSGPGSYSGTTTIADGALELTHNTAAGSGTIDVGGQQLLLNDGVNIANPVTIAGGTLLNSRGAGTLGPTGNLTLQADSNVTINGTGTGLTIDRVIIQSGGAAGLTVDGGTLTLTEHNFFSGGVSLVNGGALVLGPGADAGTGTLGIGSGRININNGSVVSNDLTINGGTIATIAGSGELSGNLTIAGPTTLIGGTSGNSAPQLTISGNITQSGGTFGITKAGTGTVVLSGNNSYGGGTTISAGTLVLASDTAGGTAGITVGANQLIINNDAVVANAVTIAGGSIGNTLLGGTLSGALTLGATSNLFSSGNGLTLAGNIGESASAGLNANGGLVTLTGTNSYTGITTINGGTLRATTDTALPDSGVVVLADGASAVLDLTSNQRIGSLAGGGPVGGPANGSVTLGANTLSTGGNNASTVFSGVITGNAATALVKEGSGTLTLTGSSTYSGATSISAGTLALSGASAVAGTGTLAVAGQTLQIDSGANVANAVSIAGGSITNTTGAGQLSGPLTLASTSSLGSSGGGLAVSGAIGGSSGAGLNATGGTVTLSGTNSYSGTTTVSAGTLRASSDAALPDSGAVVLADNASAVLDLTSDQRIGSLAGGAPVGGPANGSVTLGTHTLSSGGNNSSTTFSGVISGTAATALVKEGSGTFTLTGANTYGGGTRIDAGTLTISGSAAVAGAGAITVAGNRLDIDNSANVANAVNVSGGTIGNSAGAGTLSGPLTLAATSTLASSAGGLTVSGDIGQSSASGLTTAGGVITLSGSNSYTGTTNISAGTLRATRDVALLDSGAVVLADGVAAVLDVTSDQRIGSLAGGGPVGGPADGSVTLGSNTLSTGGNNSSTTFSGVISGSGASLVKEGSGNFTLAGASTYSGGSTVAAGTLTVAGSTAAAGTGAITVGAQRLNIDSGATVANAVGIAGGTIGNSTGSGTLSGPLTLASTSSLDSTGSGLAVTGAIGQSSGAAGLNTSGGSITLAGANTYTGTTTVNSGTLALQGGATIDDSAAVVLSSSGTAQLTLLSSETIGSLAGGSAGNGTVALGANTLSTGGSNVATSFAGVISGTGGKLVKQGSNTFTLTGTSTFDGGSTVAGGTLAVSGAGAVAGTGAIGVGAQTLSIENGANVANAVTLNGGTLANTAGTGTLSGPLTLTGTFTLSSSGGGLTVAGAIAESGASAGLNVSGGSIVLSGANTYTGATTLNSGTLALQGGQAIQDGAAVVLNGAGVTLDLQTSETIGSLSGSGTAALGGRTLSTGGGNVDTTFSGVISGSGGGSLVKQGSSTFTLTGASTYDGGTTLSGGTLALSGSSAQAGSGAIAVGSQRLNIENGANVANAVGIGGGTVGNTSGSGTLSGPLTLASTSNLASSGSGLAVSGSIGESNAGAGLGINGSNVTLSGSNSYTGATTVSGGTLHVLNDAALPDGGALVLADGSAAVVDLASNQRVGSLAGGANGGLVTLGANTLSTGGSGASTSFSGVISGTGTTSLVKEGSGIFTLAGANTYSGATTVNAGTLAVANTLASPTLQVNGGTLALQAAEVLPDTAALTVASAGTVTLAATETVGSLVLAGTLGGSGTLVAGTYQLNSGTTLSNADLGHGTLTSSGSSTLNGHSAADTLTVSDGTLALRSGGATLTALPSVGVNTGATLTLQGDESIQALTLQGTVNGSGTLGAATYALNGGTATANLGAGALSSDGTSTLGGTSAATSVAVKTGTLTLGSDGRFTAAPAVDVSAGATFALGVGNETIGTLGGQGTVDLGAGTLSTGSGGDSTFAGVITGIGNLTKQGSSTFTLTGSNLYSGTTRIDAGTLVVGDGANSGSLASGVIVDNGVLRSARADNVSFAQDISGTGSVEQAGSGRLTMQGSNKTYTGATQVSSGELATAGDEGLPDNSAVTVAAAARLTLGGSETVKSVDADGSVAVASLLRSEAGSLDLKGPVSAVGGAAITLSSQQQIDAVNDGNLFGSRLNIVAGGAVNLASGKDGGARRDLALGTVDASGGGQIDAAALTLADNISVHGGTLALVSSAASVGTQPDAKRVGKITPAQRQIAFAGDVVQQTGGTITVDTGATLSVQASNGGSVQLLSDGNLFNGGLAVLAGQAVAPWAANLQTLTFGGSTLEYSVQSRVRVAGTTVNVGGTGIEGDVVTIKADTLKTASGAAIVARLPFDNLVGTITSEPGLTLELTPAAFALTYPFGVPGTPIAINVGSKAWGNRTVLPVDGGYMTVLPQGGAKGSTSVILQGPAVAGTYGFFFDGAGQQTEIPVFYNGITPVTPQVSGSISATVSVSESARKERFEEAVRTENVAVRLRSGVIAEVGAGRPATVGIEGARPPAGCTPAAGALACAAQ